MLKLILFDTHDILVFFFSIDRKLDTKKVLFHLKTADAVKMGFALGN